MQSACYLIYPVSYWQNTLMTVKLGTTPVWAEVSMVCPCHLASVGNKRSDARLLSADLPLYT